MATGTVTKSTRRQGLYWILTMPKDSFTAPEIQPDYAKYFAGQLEVGKGGYEHWQVVVAFRQKKSLIGVKSIFGITCHAELSRSSAANEYVWKDDTAVPGTRFRYGKPPINRNSATDWESVWGLAISGDILEVEPSVRVQHYRTLRRISQDYAQAGPLVRTTYVLWGHTGTGKSKTAWERAGMEAYPKDPRSIWWDGYEGQEFVVIDEFRGGIDIAHLLRWTDRYPLRLPIKGGYVVPKFHTIYITSNLSPNDWYPDCDSDTLEALKRRLIVTHFPKPL